MTKPTHSMQDLGGFPTTRWTVVRAIESSHGECQRALLGEFLERYRPALAAHLAYAFRGLSAEDRADLLQSFILDKLISSQILDHAAESRGKLRNYLKTSLSNYAKDWTRKATNRFHRATRNLDTAEHDHGYQSRHTETFELAWARQVVREAVERFRKDVESRNRQQLWMVFEHRILKPAAQGVDATPIDTLCIMIDTTPKRVYNLVITARRNFSRHLKDVVSEYATDTRDIETEIRDLLNYLYHDGD